ncbi:peroxiredoxin family protein [Catenovulum sp. SX2]|uniref:peroxiredoxin family protein n=1 Tax=Catenovulum sp. SX2 TaxID=3398614 RepID=UPI003F846341
MTLAINNYMNKFKKGCKAALVSISLLAVANNAWALEENQPAPDFTLKTVSGENVKLSEQKGQIILLNFWASWCGPCRKEMPALEDLHQQFSDLGVAVWGVNVEQDPEPGKGFLKEIEVSFPIMFDSENTVTAAYDVAAMPTTILIDRDGKVRAEFKGYKAGYEKKYAKAIKRLIRE